MAPGDEEANHVADDLSFFDPPSVRTQNLTPLGSLPPVKRIRDGVYPVHLRAAGTSGAGSCRGGVQGVPLRPPSFPLVKAPTSHRLSCRDLPPVPPPTPEPSRVEDLVLNVPPSGQDPPPSTSQWVDLGMVPIPTANDTIPSLVNGDPMDMLNHLHTG